MKIADQFIITSILVFSRLGACLMLTPGISNSRVPVQIRLFLALSLSLALIFFIEPSIHSEILKISTSGHLLLAITSEIIVGVTLGFLSHALFWAMQFAANIIAMSIGYSGQHGLGILESTPESPLADLINIGALFVFFTSDMHLVLLHGLLISYEVIPANFTLQSQASLIDAIDVLSQTFLAVLHVSAPFLLYAILVNFSVGLLNKMIPSIPIYFISMPFVITGGLLLFLFLFPELLRFFSGELSKLIGEISDVQ